MTHITIERAKAQRIADAFEDLRKNYGISYIEESVDINQALAAQPAPVPLTEMAQILGDRLAKEQAVYLSMETAKSFVTSMLAAQGITKGQP